MDRHVISEGDCVVRVNIVGLVGVQGLRSAFFVAGAEAQVMTLWKVSDEATVGLISRYYGRLRDGSGRAAALRESQLAMLQDAPTPIHISGRDSFPRETGVPSRRDQNASFISRGISRTPRSRA